MTRSLPSGNGGEPVRGDAKAILAASTLPQPAKDLIAMLVRKTRLWKREKAAVAMEMIAHFEDGLEAGRSAEELVGSFGDVKTAARLIRRGKKRNRPWWWHVQRRLLQALAAFVLVYIGLAMILVLRHPNPAIDYVAELNRAVLAAPPADRAWPIYRDAWTKARIWDFKDDTLYMKDADGQQGRAMRPGDPGWPEAVAFLRQQKPLLDAVRVAAMKPSLGWELRTGGRAAMSAEDRMALMGTTEASPEIKAASRVDQLMSKSTMMVLLPFLSPMRQTAKVVAADMRLAASEGDADRVLADYRAMMGMAQQCGQTPILINELVGLNSLSLADQTLLEINEAAPASLARCRVDLLHVMASVEPMFKMDLAGERMLLMDMIQRVYSDNGKGDGTLTLDGLQVMTRVAEPMGPATPNRVRVGNAVGSLLLPAAAVGMVSRKELTERTDRFYAVAAEDATRPLWSKLRTPARADEMIGQWRGTAASNVHYGLLAIMVPALSKAGITFDQARAFHEAAMVALSLEAYHDNTGSYPATLAELVPHYLPVRPLDYSTGQPLRYKLKDGKPLLYGLGKDGVDDGGVWTDSRDRWPKVPEKGDWVLYPPVEKE